MGITALGLDWRLAAEAGAVSRVPGEAILAVGTGVFAMLVLRWLARTKDAPQEIVVERDGPITASYFAAIGAAVSLLALAAGPYSHDLALVLWASGAIASAGILVYFLGRWIEQGIDEVQLTPAVLLPAVANAASVYAARAVGVTDISWFSYGMALACWVLLAPLSVHRLLVAQPRLPRKLVPQFAILVSSPAILADGWFVLNGGTVDALFHILTYSSLFFAILTVRLTKMAWGEPFNVGMWAWAFPFAALAGTCERLAIHHVGAATEALAATTLAIATMIVGACSAATVHGWLQPALPAPLQIPIRSKKARI